MSEADDRAVARDTNSRERARRMIEEAQAKRLLNTRVADLSLWELLDLLPLAEEARLWLRSRGLD